MHRHDPNLYKNISIRRFIVKFQRLLRLRRNKRKFDQDEYMEKTDPTRHWEKTDPTRCWSSWIG